VSREAVEQTQRSRAFLYACLGSAAALCLRIPKHIAGEVRVLDRPGASGHGCDSCDAGSSEQRSKAHCCAAPHSRSYVAIQLQSRLNVVAPEALAHSFDVDSRFEEQRGVGVAEAVRPDCRQIRLLADPTGEAPPDDVGIRRRLSADMGFAMVAE